MNRIKKFIIPLLIFLFSSLVSYAQNDCIVAFLANDLSSSTAEFKTIVKQSEGFQAWQLLNKEKPALRTNIEELALVSKNLETINIAGGYLKWKGLQGVGKIINRTLDAASDLKIIDRVKTLRKKLTSDYKRSGNFGWAETEVSGLTKSEYYAHSGIDELTGTLPDRVPDISVKPQSEIFPWSTVPNSAGYPIARNIDTEYKILTEIAQKLGSNTNATGKIILFTERAPCTSCSNVIELFSKKYQKIDIEVINNNGVLLTDF
jgi:hypothetical protein